MHTVKLFRRIPLLVTLAYGLLFEVAQADVPIIRSVRSGAWSSASTWEGGQVPGAGVSVLVRAGHVVAYDMVMKEAVRTLHVAGTLRFATDQDTQLNAGLIRVQRDEDVSEEGFACDAHVPDGAAVHYRGDGRFMLSGNEVSRRRLFRPEMLDE